MTSEQMVSVSLFWQLAHIGKGVDASAEPPQTSHVLPLCDNNNNQVSRLDFLGNDAGCRAVIVLFSLKSRNCLEESLLLSFKKMMTEKQRNSAMEPTGFLLTFALSCNLSSPVDVLCLRRTSSL